MDKSQPPTSFGVFKPVDHTVIAFRSDAEVRDAVTALRAMGFADEALVRYTGQEMMDQVDAEEPAAGVLATFGQELNLIRAQRALAQSGCGFLVVHVPDEAQATRVAGLAHAMQAVAAQHYGRFVIEELIDLPADLDVAAMR